MFVKALSAALMSEAASVDPLPPELSPNLTHAAHGGALAMLAVIFLTLGLVAAFGIYLRHRSRRMHLTQALLDSLHESSAESFSHTPAASWEKPADWWKH